MIHDLAHTDDPVDDMRRGWDIHVDFGLRHPTFYLLMYGTDRPGRRPPAADEAHDLLLKFPDRAAVGRLRVRPPAPPDRNRPPPRLAPPARPLTRTVARSVRHSPDPPDLPLSPSR